jgi:uncharacterized membrane-anchored protein
MTENYSAPPAAAAEKHEQPSTLVLLWILAVVAIVAGVITLFQENSDTALATPFLAGGFTALLFAAATQAIVSTLNGRYR